MTAVRRYAVLSKNGEVVNSILIDDPMPDGYWPGYGYYLIDQGPVGGPDQAPTIRTKLDVPQFAPRGLQIGDTVDLNTGVVTKFVPQLKVVQGDDGKNVTVSSAPDVKIAQSTDIIKQSTGGEKSKVEGLK